MNIAAGEHLLRHERPKFHHVLIDVIGLIQIQAHSRQILQPQVLVVRDHCVLQPGLQVCRPAGIGGEQIHRGMQTYLSERLRHDRVFRTVKFRLNSVDVDLDWVHLTDQYHVIT